MTTLHRRQHRRENRTRFVLRRLHLVVGGAAVVAATIGASAVWPWGWA
jgi:hypothetical protein